MFEFNYQFSEEKLETSDAVKEMEEKQLALTDADKTDTPVAQLRQDIRKGLAIVIPNNVVNRLKITNKLKELKNAIKNVNSATKDAEIDEIIEIVFGKGAVKKLSNSHNQGGINLLETKIASGFQNNNYSAVPIKYRSYLHQVGDKICMTSSVTGFRLVPLKETGEADIEKTSIVISGSASITCAATKDGYKVYDQAASNFLFREILLKGDCKINDNIIQLAQCEEEYNHGIYSIRKHADTELYVTDREFAYQEAQGLVEELVTKKKRFFPKFYAQEEQFIEETQAFIRESNNELIDANKILAEHRSWKGIMVNIGLALTGIGAAVMTFKAIYKFGKQVFKGEQLGSKFELYETTSAGILKKQQKQLYQLGSFVKTQLASENDFVSASDEEMKSYNDRFRR